MTKHQPAAYSARIMPKGRSALSVVGLMQLTGKTYPEKM
jgi:hypothetical protein